MNNQTVYNIASMSFHYQFEWETMKWFLFLCGVTLFRFAKTLSQSDFFLYAVLSLISCVFFSCCIIFHVLSKWKNNVHIAYYILGYFLSFSFNQFLSFLLFFRSKWLGEMPISLFHCAAVYIPIYILSLTFLYFKGPPSNKMKRISFYYTFVFGIILMFLFAPCHQLSTTCIAIILKLSEYFPLKSVVVKQKKYCQRITETRYQYNKIYCTRQHLVALSSFIRTITLERKARLLAKLKKRESIGVTKIGNVSRKSENV